MHRHCPYSPVASPHLVRRCCRRRRCRHWRRCDLRRHRVADRTSEPGDRPHGWVPRTATRRRRGGHLCLARGGPQLRGWLLAPPRQGAPMVVCFHGFSMNRHEFEDRQWLREAGYGCLIFDFRGHGESRGTSRPSQRRTRSKTPSSHRTRPRALRRRPTPCGLRDIDGRCRRHSGGCLGCRRERNCDRLRFRRPSSVSSTMPLRSG
jgi:pimeloyl-ACP methyl ester carboxylesterase